MDGTEIERPLASHDLRTRHLDGFHVARASDPLRVLHRAFALAQQLEQLQAMGAGERLPDSGELSVTCSTCSAYAGAVRRW
jgi:hypothetical protein